MSPELTLVVDNFKNRQIMRAALGRIQHPSYASNEDAKRAVIVAAVNTIMPTKVMPTFANEQDRVAFLHFRRSLLGTSPLRHDMLNIARDILAGK